MLEDLAIFQHRLILCLLLIGILDEAKVVVEGGLLLGARLADPDSHVFLLLSHVQQKNTDSQILAHVSSAWREREIQNKLKSKTISHSQLQLRNYTKSK